MKKDIHPEYKSLKLKIGQDEIFTFSTYKGKELLMDVDFREHPAWDKSKMQYVSKSNKSVSNFNKKFGDISLLK
ncbi:MAG: 50S ribosomal protein L31 [Rickettsia sp.]|nr:50S ribosomal protein L31 [Rickettsia sp.]